LRRLQSLWRLKSVQRLQSLRRLQSLGRRECRVVHESKCVQSFRTFEDGIDQDVVLWPLNFQLVS
jgi:hypothetical protein